MNPACSRSICGRPLASARSSSSCLYSSGRWSNSAWCRASAARSASDCIRVKCGSLNGGPAAGFATACTRKIAPETAAAPQSRTAPSTLPPGVSRWADPLARSRATRPARSARRVRPALRRPETPPALSTGSSNFARGGRWLIAGSDRGRCSGNRPSTATPRRVFFLVRSNQHAFSTPVHRIEAWTIRGRSACAPRPAPSACAIRCMKSSNRYRSWASCWFSDSTRSASRRIHASGPSIDRIIANRPMTRNPIMRRAGVAGLAAAGNGRVGRGPPAPRETDFYSTRFLRNASTS